MPDVRANVGAELNASQIMRDFALRTGLTAEDGPPKRYLWTDAFAVCNFLGLFVRDGDDAALDLARHLVEQTHCVLGRHRPDDSRHGWISGLSEAEGARHPTRGGLRIGKPLPERGPDEAVDPELEWERDGQYFHYLTKWMHALARMTQVTGDPTFHRWAFELAKTAHARFTEPAPPQRVKWIHWKMSIDLSRPQVASMGHHDALDGLLTCHEMQAGPSQAGFDLRAEIEAMEKLCVGREWDTEDALGIGGLLCDAWRLAQLVSGGAVVKAVLLVDLLRASLRGLEALLRQQPFRRPAGARLAFRELGLSIGLRASGRLRERIAQTGGALFGGDELRDPLRLLAHYESIADNIEQFWLEPANRRGPTWQAHRDINEVMLATSVLPCGYLGQRGVGGEACDERVRRV